MEERQNMSASDDEDYEYAYSSGGDEEEEEEEEEKGGDNVRGGSQMQASSQDGASSYADSISYHDGDDDDDDDDDEDMQDGDEDYKQGEEKHEEDGKGGVFEADPQRFFTGKNCIKIMAANDMKPEMGRRCMDVTDTLGISLAAATALLHKHKWSKEALMEAYTVDYDKTLKGAGVYHRIQCRSDEPTTKKDDSNATLVSCPICFEDVDSLMYMPCGHGFCSHCWNSFCEVAVSEGPACVLKTCPHAGCGETVTEEEMEAALGASSPTLAKYRSYQLRRFIDSSPCTRWCPGPGCDRVACVSSALSLANNAIAQCSACDTSFCVPCGGEPHLPATCKELSMWEEKNRSESETANWIIVHTKPCPKCRKRIEKNQGCSHMTCSQCRHEFCWICMGNWAGHRTCNRFEESATDLASAKRELDRYLHFYKRFHTHQEGEDFAKKKLQQTETVMAEIMKESKDDQLRWADVEFLKQAHTQVLECRRVLKNTYVLGYFLDPTEQKKELACFEHHQEMLEGFTEKLSELSEKPVPEIDRSLVVNQTRVVKKFVQAIVEFVESGMEC